MLIIHDHFDGPDRSQFYPSDSDLPNHLYHLRSSQYSVAFHIIIPNDWGNWNDPDDYLEAISSLTVWEALPSLVGVVRMSFVKCGSTSETWHAL